MLSEILSGKGVDCPCTGCMGKSIVGGKGGVGGKGEVGGIKEGVGGGEVDAI